MKLSVEGSLIIARVSERLHSLNLLIGGVRQEQIEARFRTGGLTLLQLELQLTSAHPCGPPVLEERMVAGRRVTVKQGGTLEDAARAAAQVNKAAAKAMTKRRKRQRRDGDKSKE